MWQRFYQIVRYESNTFTQYINSKWKFFITFICKILFFEPQNSSWFSNKGIFRYHRDMILWVLFSYKKFTLSQYWQTASSAIYLQLTTRMFVLLKITLDTVYPRLAQNLCIILFWYWLILTLFHMVALIMTDCLYVGTGYFHEESPQCYQWLSLRRNSAAQLIEAERRMITHRKNMPSLVGMVVSRQISTRPAY